jgi:hypothetical protein
MGLRGELFSTRVLLQNRTYFFNVKENRLGDLYLNIVESKNRDEGGFDRQSVILFADDLQEFLKGFDESLRVMEKEVRQRRQSARAFSGDAKGITKGDTKSNTSGERQGRRSAAGDRKPDSAERHLAERHSGGRQRKERHSGEEGKRVVVRKRK